MPTIPPTTAPPCPPWCERDPRHDGGERFRRHVGPTVPVPVLVDGGAPALAETSVVRDDEGGRPGATTIAVGDVEVSLADARALALSLLALADRAERAPRRVGGARRHRGALVVSRAVHDTAICGWRIATRSDEDPSLAFCAGCGCAVEIGAPAGAR